MIDPDYLVRLIRQAQYGHLQHRFCTVDAPMPMADKDRYRWSHPDADVIGQVPAANRLDLCRCPHCGLTFTSFPRPD
jgi:hypothetical protein